MKSVSFKYIEIAKEKSGLSFYAIAKKIGTTPQAINNLKHREIELNDNALIQLAQIAQIAPNKLLAEVHIKKAKGQAERAFWQEIKKFKMNADCILCQIQKVSKLAKNQVTTLLLPSINNGTIIAN